VEVTVSADGVVAVRDHGPGVPADDVPLIFDRFYRGATARGRSGSGLGLAIVRQVAESHGGSVRVESPEDGGARFVLALPGAPA
jgi:two-component system sensor histidine kinase MprB